jgi:hypothetical protein
VIVGREDIHIERLSEEHGWLRFDPAGSDVEIGDTLQNQGLRSWSGPSWWASIRSTSRTSWATRESLKMGLGEEVARSGGPEDLAKDKPR